MGGASCLRLLSTVILFAAKLACYAAFIAVFINESFTLVETTPTGMLKRQWKGHLELEFCYNISEHASHLVWE